MITCYPSPGKRKALKLAHAFAAGCAGRVAAIGQPRLDDGPAFFYGMTGHSLPLIARCRAEEREWFYADNAYYFGRGTHFRVTRDALMHDGSGRHDPARFTGFGIAPRPWRRDGRHIVIATQSELFHQMVTGQARENWTRAVIAKLRDHTDRPVVVCHKPPPPWPDGAPHENFEAALAGAWAVVSHSSSVMVKALIEGVPVFSLGQSMASRMALADLSMIEAPRYSDDRAPWLWALAANQWTRAEMWDGTCWRSGIRDQGSGIRDRPRAPLIPDP